MAYNILSDPIKKSKLESYDNSFYEDFKPQEDFSKFYKPKMEEDFGEYENYFKNDNNKKREKGLDIFI